MPSPSSHPRTCIDLAAADQARHDRPRQSTPSPRRSWRAGQLPGQTSTVPAIACLRSTDFNGGPGNCPAKLVLTERDFADLAVTSMEGRAIARPNRTRPCRSAVDLTPLQWRAGQLPGQTVVREVVGGRDVVTSMEGRAIARPNPKASCIAGIRALTLQWRAGQLPGQTSQNTAVKSGMTLLQWRAGQLPGQTQRVGDLHRHDHVTSMEGRAIARPNMMECDRPGCSNRTSMEGRAIARPNTGSRRRCCRAGPHFNGGPGNCPAKPVELRMEIRKIERTSMEGRAIARPNHGQEVVAEAGPVTSMEGRAIARPNCQLAERLAHADRTSMEGRAIARPNS